jgi:hypothetical protein
VLFLLFPLDVNHTVLECKTAVFHKKRNMTAREWCMKYFRAAPDHENAGTTTLICEQSGCCFQVEDRRGAIRVCMTHLRKVHHTTLHGEPAVSAAAESSCHGHGDGADGACRMDDAILPSELSAVREPHDNGEWHTGFFAVVSDVMLMTTSAARHRSALADILTCAIHVLAREVEWEHTLVALKRGDGTSDQESCNAMMFSTTARNIAMYLLLPHDVAATKSSVLMSLSRSLVLGASDASVAAVSAMRDLIADSVMDAFSNLSRDEVGKKRLRADPAVAAPRCKLDRFARNAFRGPYLNQVSATLGAFDELSECESVMMLPNPSRRGHATQKGRSGEHPIPWDRDEVCLTPGSLDDYYRHEFPDGSERKRIQIAHATQLLANGVASWLKQSSRMDLESLGAALRLPAVNLRLATSLELVNFITMSMLPTPSVGRLVRQLHVAYTEALQRTSTQGHESATVVDEPHDRGLGTGGSLCAIGSQSRSLESAQRFMSESILYGTAGKKPELFSRGELLHQAAQRCRVPLESIVAALAEFGGRGSDADLVSNVGLPAMPSRAEFASMDAEAKHLLHQSILRHQFREVEGSKLLSSALLPSGVGCEISYEAQRARHLARIPLDSLVVLMIATKTSDAYEQLMIRYHRIPFSPRTTKFELGQWLWSDEHIVLVGNLLSYVTESERLAAMKAVKLSPKHLPFLLSMGTNSVESDAVAHASSESFGRHGLVDLCVFLLRKRHQRQ